MGVTEGDDGAGQRRRSGRPPGRRPLAEGSSEDTRREILRHAAHLFSSRGYLAVSLDDVAVSAGLTRATLYYHYRSKADIFVAAVEAMGEFVREAVGAIVAREELSVPDRVRLLVTAWREGPQMDEGIGAAESDGPPPEGAGDEYAVEAALPHLSPRHQARVRAAFDDTHGLIRGLMAEGVARGELRADLPPAVLEYAFGQLFQPARYPAGLSRREVDERLLDLLLRGAAPE